MVTLPTPNETIHSIMSRPDVSHFFELFDLRTDATLAELDKRYYDYMMEAINKRKTSPASASSRKEELDEAYSALLRDFITRDYALLQHHSSRQKYTCHDLEVREQDMAVQQVLGQDSSQSKKLYHSLNQSGEGDKRGEGNEPDWRDILAHTISTAIAEAEGDNIKSHNDTHDTNGMDEMEEDVTMVSRDQDCSSIASVVDSPTLSRYSEVSGDIFDIPDGSIIALTVNCLGAWGAGFAVMLKWRFPFAFEVYRSYCFRIKAAKLLAGTSLLIPPQAGDYYRGGRRYPRRWIACLFTSFGYGKRAVNNTNPGRDDVETILLNTDSALVDLRRDIVNAQEDQKNGGSPIGNLYSPKLNFGLFGVPWEQTRQLIREVFATYEGSWTVMSLPYPAGATKSGQQ